MKHRWTAFAIWYRRFAGLRRILLPIAAVLIVSNWPVLLLGRFPGEMNLPLALGLTVVSSAVLLTLWNELNGSKIERFAPLVVIVAILSAAIVSLYVEFGETIARNNTPVYVGNFDGVPRWDQTGVARKEVLSAIPGTGIEITVCATPIVVEDGEEAEPVTNWLIRRNERRSVSWVRPYQDGACNEFEQPILSAVTPSPERRKSSLALAAIQDSIARYGAASGERGPGAILVIEKQEDRPLLSDGAVLIGAILFLNIIVIGFLSATLKSSLPMSGCRHLLPNSNQT